MIYLFTPFMPSAVVWSGLNKVTRTTLIRVWAPHSMARVADRETLSGVFIVAVSAREVVASPPVMT